jgi:hypothetical protein
MEEFAAIQITLTEALWRGALAAAALAILAAVACRILPCRASTRHAIWLVVLVSFAAAPFVPAMWDVDSLRDGATSAEMSSRAREQATNADAEPAPAPPPVSAQTDLRPAQADLRPGPAKAGGSLRSRERKLTASDHRLAADDVPQAGVDTASRTDSMRSIEAATRRAPGRAELIVGAPARPHGSQSPAAPGTDGRLETHAGGDRSVRNSFRAERPATATTDVAPTSGTPAPFE